MNKSILLIAVIFSTTLLFACKKHSGPLPFPKNYIANMGKQRSWVGRNSYYSPYGSGNDTVVEYFTIHIGADQSSCTIDLALDRQNGTYPYLAVDTVAKTISFGSNPLAFNLSFNTLTYYYLKDSMTLSNEASNITNGYTIFTHTVN